MDDSLEENYVEFHLKFLVIKILHCWFNFLVLQEMLLPWHALWGCEHDMQCPSELLLCHKHSQCLELALRWVLPPPQASCWLFPGSQNLPGGFLSPSAAQGFGVASHQQQLVMMPDPNRLQCQFPVLWESLATLLQEQKVGKVLFSGTELCQRWYPMKTGITWVLELQRVCF